MYKDIYTCPYCEKKFTRKSNLKDHWRLHTEEKPYSCSQCDKKFALKGNLKVHERKHNKEKPFSCTICLKKLGYKISLKKHEKKCTLKGSQNMHTKERDHDIASKN